VRDMVELGGEGKFFVTKVKIFSI